MYNILLWRALRKHGRDFTGAEVRPNLRPYNFLIYTKGINCQTVGTFKSVHSPQLKSLNTQQ